MIQAMENGTLNLETQQTELEKHKADFVKVQQVRWDEVCIVVSCKGERKCAMRDRNFLYAWASKVFGFIYIYTRIYMLPTANFKQHQWQMNRCDCGKIVKLCRYGGKKRNIQKKTFPPLFSQPPTCNSTIPRYLLEIFIQKLVHYNPFSKLTYSQPCGINYKHNH